MFERSGFRTTYWLVVAVAVLCTAAIFGFFYAWVCSTMWGLGNADPRVAIAAMQAMNESVRNAVFFPAFFLTPVALGLAALLSRLSGLHASSRLFLAAALVYLFGGMLLTMAVNVPMNADLAAVAVPQDMADAEQIWSNYSGRWQIWNAVRMTASGVALLLAFGGVRAAASSSTKLASHG